MDQTAFGVVKELFGHIDNSVPDEPTSQTEHARRLFSLLAREGGQVEALGEVRCMKTPMADLGTWNEDPWPEHTYGIDASTTRPIEYNNGLVVDTASAKLGVAGTDGNRDLERDGTIRSVLYFDDDDSRFFSETFEGDEGRVDGEVLAFPGTADRTSDVTRWVSTAAQRLAEGRHALASADAIDGALFFDGSVYPLGVLYWLMLDTVDRMPVPSTWDVPQTIAEHYVDVIDRLYERGLPVIGVVKTSMTGQVLDALETKIETHDLTNDDGLRLDVPWRRDHQFVSEVLRDDSLNHLTYTSWFVHEQAIDNRPFEMLSTVADALDHGEPADYRRAFFYVRLPRTGGVFRVEAPLLFLGDDTQREAVQRKALKEIARNGDVPRAVSRADKIARISPDNRKTIEKFITSAESQFDYNQDGRWKDIEDPSEVDQ